MCKLEKYTIWNSCRLEKGRRVQILYAQGKVEVFLSTKGWRFTHVGVGLDENYWPTKLRTRLVWQTLPTRSQAGSPRRGGRQLRAGRRSRGATANKSAWIQSDLVVPTWTMVDGTTAASAQQQQWMMFYTAMVKNSLIPKRTQWRV